MAIRTWSDDQLIEAVKNSTSLSAVASKLGLRYGGYQAKAIKRRLLELRVDVSHMDKVGKIVFGTDIKEKFCTWHRSYEPIEEFGRTATGATSSCKKGNSERQISFQRQKKYGISDDEFRSMLDRCSGVCEVCGGSSVRELAIDHDHACCDGKYSCGKCVRGLLCTSCNTALGFLHDSVDRLEKLIDYLKAWEEKGQS